MNTPARVPSRALLATALAATMLTMGCANMSEAQRGTAIGAGVGAVAGAVIGKGKGAAIGAGLGAAGGYVWSRHMESKHAQMQEATEGTGIEVTQTDDNRLKLNIPSDISFDTGRADIKPEMRPILDSFAQGLDQQSNLEVYILGHTDSTGSDAINEPLSVARANSVRDYLAARGIDTRWVVTEGRSSREPVASNNTVAGRAANRRVEIFLAERVAEIQQTPGTTPVGTPAR